MFPESIGAYSCVAGDHDILQVRSGEGCVVLDKKEGVFIVRVDLQQRANQAFSINANARSGLHNRSTIEGNVYDWRVR